MSKAARFECFAGLFTIAVLAATGSVNAQSDCSNIAGKTQQLILVLSPSMSSASASVQYFERQNDGVWQPVGKKKSAILGRNGLGWSWAFKQFASSTEPIKKEGDGRTPAGFFSVGQAFGFASSGHGNYVHLKKGEHFCVDDPGSPYYGAIVSKEKAGKGVSGEDMAVISLYRQGLFLDYPANRETKGGSCIFVHVWRAKNKPTVGCVALAEDDVKDLQRWSAAKVTVMGILPEKAWPELRPCFPGA